MTREGGYLDEFGQFADVVLAADGRRTRRGDPGDELLLAADGAARGVQVGLGLAVRLAQRLARHQRPVRVPVDDVRVAPVRHRPVELILDRRQSHPFQPPSPLSLT